VGLKLAGGTASYSDDEAIDTVLWYASATETVRPDPRDAFTPHEVPLYAYRTYDCVPASSGPSFTDLDLYVSAGLNARVDVATIARLRSFANRAAGPLERARQSGRSFWDLDPDEVGDAPPAGTVGVHLREAWRQGVATPGLGIARVHKTLHHKCPHLVPLLDNESIGPIRAAAEGRPAWRVIHDEINQQRDAFQVLADRFDDWAGDNGGVPLTFLRLYDILIWMQVMNQRKAVAISRG
jgi:hypothetical protein